MIVTYYVYPPIPIRCFDYCAFHDGNPELQGFGATEAEAIADLQTLLEERAAEEGGDQ